MIYIENIRRGKGYSVYEGGKNGEQTAGKLSFSKAMDVLREMLRAVSTEEEEQLLSLLGTGEKPGHSPELPMPLSAMLPSPGTFHALIRLALRERRVNEALGLLAYMRRKEMNVFARSLAELAADPKVPPRLAIKFLHEMERIGLPASQHLLHFLVVRLAGLELPEPRGRCAVGFVRRLCRRSRQEEGTAMYFRSGNSGNKVHITGATLARCISMASPDLWPRWGRAVGIWAKRSQEDASVPFRALMKLIGVMQDVSLPSEHVSSRHQQKVLHALSQTGLLERMLTKRVLTEAEASLVKEIQKDEPT